MQEKKGKLFLVTAPSGAGKTTLVQHVITRLSPEYSLQKVITYTTKRPRPGEREGIEYHFLSEEDFIQRISEGFFIEHSTAYGAYYGFPKDIFFSLSQGQSFMGIVDIAGAKAIKSYFPDSILIGIRPPDQHALEQRLRQRGEDNSSEIAFRLTLAQNELTHLEKGLFNYIMVNDLLDDAILKLEEIVRKELE
jgi:guanylate kinase